MPLLDFPWRLRGRGRRVNRYFLPIWVQLGQNRAKQISQKLNSNDHAHTCARTRLQRWWRYSSTIVALARIHDYHERSTTFSLSFTKKRVGLQVLNSEIKPSNLLGLQALDERVSHKKDGWQQQSPGQRSSTMVGFNFSSFISILLLISQIPLFLACASGINEQLHQSSESIYMGVRVLTWVKELGIIHYFKEMEQYNCSHSLLIKASNNN